MRKTLGNLATDLRSALGSSVGRVIIGEVMPLESDLPAIQVFPITTDITLSGTVKDNQSRTVAVRVIQSVPKEMGQTVSQLNTASSILALCDLIEKKDTDGSINTASVLGVLRQDPTINSQALYDNDMSVDYGSLDELGFPNATATVQVSFISRNLTK